MYELRLAGILITWPKLLAGVYSAFAYLFYSLTRLYDKMDVHDISCIQI